VIVNICTNNN